MSSNSQGSSKHDVFIDDQMMLQSSKERVQPIRKSNQYQISFGPIHMNDTVNAILRIPDVKENVGQWFQGSSYQQSSATFNVKNSEAQFNLN